MSYTWQRQQALLGTVPVAVWGPWTYVRCCGANESAADMCAADSPKHATQQSWLRLLHSYAPPRGHSAFSCVAYRPPRRTLQSSSSCHLVINIAMLKRFEGKVVLVTGGGSGIGLSGALRIASEGEFWRRLVTTFCAFSIVSVHNTACCIVSGCARAVAHVP